MKVLNVVQGSPEWLAARLGIPTASAYERVMTPKTLKPSAQAGVYRNQLLAEWLLGYPIDWSGSSQFMERGTAMEPQARAYYEMQRDVEVQVVGFVMRDDELTGGSPDGLVGEDGGLEIKCPAIHTHIGYMLNPVALVAEYHSQVQGYLYLTDRQWWDIISYSPDLPAVVARIEREDEYIDALDGALGNFISGLLAARRLLEPHRQAREAAVREAMQEAAA